MIDDWVWGQSTLPIWNSIHCPICLGYDLPVHRDAIFAYKKIITKEGGVDNIANIHCWLKNRCQSLITKWCCLLRIHPKICEIFVTLFHAGLCLSKTKWSFFFLKIMHNQSHTILSYLVALLTQKAFSPYFRFLFSSLSYPSSSLLWLFLILVSLISVGQNVFLLLDVIFLRLMLVVLYLVWSLLILGFVMFFLYIYQNLFQC